jgi:hypothetical protein
VNAEQIDLFQAAPSRPEQAREARDLGMARAAAGAEHAVHGWREAADRQLEAYIARIGIGGTFTVSDLRVDALKGGDSPEPRAWGPVAMAASRAGLIEKHGYEKCADPTRHCGISTVWRVVSLHRAAA